MTPHQLIKEIVEAKGPCERVCAYCPENLYLSEVKECIEKMYKKIYELQADKDMLLDELVKIRAAFRQEIGYDYKDE